MGNEEWGMRNDIVTALCIALHCIPRSTFHVPLFRRTFERLSSEPEKLAMFVRCAACGVASAATVCRSLASSFSLFSTSS